MQMKMIEMKIWWRLSDDDDEGHDDHDDHDDNEK